MKKDNKIVEEREGIGGKEGRGRIRKRRKEKKKEEWHKREYSRGNIEVI